MSESEVVLAYSKQLREYAEHFEQCDWNYTRDISPIKHIRYTTDYAGYDHPLRRLGRAAKHLLGRRDDISRVLAFSHRRHPIITLRTDLLTDPHLPDGVLDNGAIITHWEETGEYLQYVQPSVGSLIADWMDDEPDNPHAVRVALEMKRINDAYGERLAPSEPTP